MIRAALLLAFVAFTIYGVTIVLTAPGDRAQRRCEHGRLPRPVRPRGDRRCGESADRPPRQARVERDRGVARRVVLRRDLRPRRATRCLSVACRRRLARLLSAPLRRARPPRAVGGRGTSRAPSGLDGITASVAGAAIGSARAARGRAPERRRARRARSRRTSPIRSATSAPALAVFGIFALSGLARGAALARPRGRRPRDRRSQTRIYLFQLDTYVAGSDLDILWPLRRS